MGLLILLFFVALLTFLFAWHLFPFSHQDLQNQRISTILLDRHGIELRHHLSADDHHALPISIDAAGEWIIPALIAAEDKRFLSHPGIDVIAISRAIGQNLRSGETISGASTISTQVIRLTDPRRRTLRTKLIEAFRALQLEASHDKSTILEHYLNRTPYGGNRTGIRAGALAWFDKAPSQLTLAEAALLAGLPQAPTRLRPDRNPDGAIKRRNWILDRMLDLQFISETEHETATTAALELKQASTPFLAPHYCDYLLRRPHRSGTIHTTLDARLQADVEARLRQHVLLWQDKGLKSGAVLVLDVPTGEIRAMVGSPDYHSPTSGQVNGTLALRSPGSLLKPFAYDMAFHQGRAIPATLVPDTPVDYAGYAPQNFSGQFHGEVTHRQALALSYNIPALKTVQSVGLNSFLARLRTAGFTTLNQTGEHYGLNLVLGGCDVTLLDAARAYLHFARCNTPAAYLVNDCLSGTERGEFDLPRHAWKTGTSARHRDAWTIAWTPDHLVAVWLGNPMPSTVDGLTGTDSAAPLARSILGTLEHSSHWYERPADIVSHPICPQTGHRHGPDCPGKTHALFIRDLSPQTGCKHKTIQPKRPSRFRILQPLDGSTVHRLSASTSLPCSASRAAHWYVDGTYLGFGKNMDLNLKRLTPGAITISVFEPTSGRTDSIHFSLREAE